MEPSSSSAAAITISVGTVSVVGTLLGMHYDALLFGLFGGLIFLSRSPSVTRYQAISSTIASVLIAGVAAPILSLIVTSNFSSFQSLGEDTLRRACAMLIGGGWQAGVPIAFDFIKQWVSRDKA